MYPKTVAVEVVGENVCVGCQLKSEHGAKAQCSIFKHRHGLKVVSAKDLDGGALDWMHGWTLHYLDNVKCDELVNDPDLHGKRVTIHGNVYPDARMLEVESVDRR